jgi:tape measure domain-containing protein
MPGIFYSMGLNPTQFLNGARNVQGATTGMHSAVTGLSGKIMSLTNLFTLAGQAMSLMKAASGPLMLGAELEQTNVQFKNLIGNANLAKAIVGQLTRFADVTPFNNKEIYDSAAALMTANVAVRDLIPSLTAVGNMASGAAKPLQQLVGPYQQILSLGRVTYEDVKQFAVAGIPIFEALGKTMRISAEEATAAVFDGKVSVNDFKKAVMDLAGPAGRWGNMMAEQSKTTIGLLSNMKAAVEKVILAFATPINDALKPYLASAIEMTDKLAAKSRNMVGTFKVLFANSGKGLHEAIDWIFNPHLWKNIGTYIEFALAGAAHKFSEALISAWRTFNATLPMGLRSDDKNLQAGEEMEKAAAGQYYHAMDIVGKVIAKEVLQGVGRTMAVVNDASKAARLIGANEQLGQKSAFEKASQGPSFWQQFMTGFKQAIDYLKRPKTDLVGEGPSSSSHASDGESDGEGSGTGGRKKIRGYHQGDVRKDRRAKDITRPDLRGRRGLDYFDRHPSSPLDRYKFGNGPSPLDYLKGKGLSGKYSETHGTHQKQGSHSWDKELKQLNTTMARIEKHISGVSVQ